MTVRSLGLVGLALASVLGACVSVPTLEPLAFAVDDAELRDPIDERSLERVAATLVADPALHLQIVGHADEDNSDGYNQALSRARADHVRDRLLLLAPELSDRLHVEARGEWDASDLGEDEAAKARNRRVELRFHYPRQCEPSFDATFVACEWSRLPGPDPVVVEIEPPSAPSPEPAPEPAPSPRPRALQDFRGPFVFGLGGYAISSGEYLRQHVRYGLGAGYLWGFDSEFRIAVGLQFDHLVDVGFVFPPEDCGTQPCSEIDRSRIRVVPELRVGGARGGVWGWLRLSAGVAVEHNEAETREAVDVVTGITSTEQVSAASWTPAPAFGIGPGVAITLTRHLFLLLDATITYTGGREPDGTQWSGTGIYDVGAGLGWIF